MNLDKNFRFILKNKTQGIHFAKEFLYKNVDRKTAVFLSGGSTPEPLYKILAKEKKLNPGAVAMVDERFGNPMHKDSNEKMIDKTGFLPYLKAQNIRFYGVLQKNLDLKNTALQYDETVRYLMFDFVKSVAIMGIGEDGHTAGLPPGAQSSKLKSQNRVRLGQNFVESFDNFPGELRERITLTFTALSQMDLLIILVFGSSKKNALRLMFEEGSIEEIPGRFYPRSEIAAKTLLITDQRL